MFYPRFQNQVYKVDPARRQPGDPLPWEKQGGSAPADVESKLKQREVAAGRGESKGDGQDPHEIKAVPEWQEVGVAARNAEAGVEQSKQSKEGKKSVKEKVKGVFGRKKNGDGDVVR